MADLSKLSLDELEKAIQAKKNERRDELVQRHSELTAELRNLEAELSELDGGPRGGRKYGPRPKNSANLKDTIAGVLTGDRKGKTKDEIVDAVLATGYKTKSDNFGTIVYQTLYKHDEFVRNEKGRYTVAK